MVKENIHTNNEVQSVGKNTHKTPVPGNITNISKKIKTTDTENVGNSKQGDVKVRTVHKKNPNE